MKKVLFTLLAVFVSLATMAQTCPMNKNMFQSAKSAVDKTVMNSSAKDDVPTWMSIHTPFTATDINGVTVNVADTLAAGKYVVIDYSCCWCSPCYSLHQSKNLEAIHNQLGSQVCVLWVEVESRNTTDQIYGTTTSQGYDGYTQGDWTHYSDNTPVTYRIIDCSSCHNMVDATGYVPEVVFVTPSGYYCQIYGESWGVTTSMSNATAVSNIQSLIANSPQPNQPPSYLNITGNDLVFAGTEVGFEVSYVSVDQVTGISWTLTGGDPSTASGNIASCTFNNAGTYTISVTVTNTTGSTTASKTITVRDGWDFGDVMDYTEGGSFQSSIGYGGDGEISWGVLFPENLMTGRNYLTNVSIYVNTAGQYDLVVYQGGTSNPQTLVYQNSYNLTTTEQWVDLPIYGGVQLDPTKNMWVTLHCDGVSYPAAYCPYVGDPNSHLINSGTSWVEITDLAASLDNVTWMIKATTSATQPPFDFAINGPTTGASGNVITFTIAGSSNATYNWTFENGNPATATGMTANTSWSNAGTYTVSVTGNFNGSTATHTKQITISNCDIDNLPFEQGFESELSSCWTILDEDGDGYTWQQNARTSAHTGSGNIASASYINGVGILYPDNWLISPRIIVPAQGATIEWWEYGDETTDFADHYSVLISTSGNQPDNFTGTLFSGEPVQSQTWRKHSRSISDYAGMEVYIAFRHHDVNNMFWLIIDDIKITSGNTAGIDNLNNANIDFYPNPVNDRLFISEVANEVSVVDINGRVVMNEKNTSTVDMSNLNNGVYYVRVITDNGIATKKVVKK